MILIIGGAYQGKLDFAINELGLTADDICRDFHLLMKEWISQGKSTNEVVKTVTNGKYKAIISDEIGLGIVPMEKEARLWREETGRALCEIAKLCDEVYRVQCGIGTRIK